MHHDARENNVAMVEETLEILKEGTYRAETKRVKLKLSPKDMRTVVVMLPDEIKGLAQNKDFKKEALSGKCSYSCENIDAFSLARRRALTKPGPVLVLNLANPVNPGGGVRRGARAQEEDLCRKSSLLLSLESKDAEKYYNYNRKLKGFLGSDALMFTPQVEILRGDGGGLLDETVIVSVLTCAAPMIRNGKGGLSNQQYEALVYNRIVGFLKASAYHGYENLVLGAWGCGAFANDARVMSDLFRRAIDDLNFNGYKVDELFDTIDFAVLDKTTEKYNYKQFFRNFGMR